MFKVKSKKIMFVILMGIIACLASLFICFGQNAYADEDEYTLERSGYIEFDSESNYHIDFIDIHDLKNLCDKHFSEHDSIKVVLVKDLCFEDYQFHVNNGKTLDFYFCGHKIYKEYPAKNAFFWVAGTLNLNGVWSENRESRGTIEAPSTTSNASVISDRGHISANDVDFTSVSREEYICPDYASHLYFVNMKGESKITNCKFTSGKAEYAGSVYLGSSADNNSSVHFKDCAFDRCYAKKQAGAIYNQAKNTCLKLENTSFNGCSSHNEGGAVLAYGSHQKCDFNNVTFNNCYSETEKGGAIYLDYLGEDQVFSNCTFNEDTAQYGGAVHVNGYDKECEGKKLIFSNCKFNGCKVGKQGGAVHNESEYVNLEFKDTLIDNCTSQHEGGAISTVGNHENVTFNKCTINKCTANQGGAIYNWSKYSNYEFKGTYITYCESTEEGGAIYSRANYEDYCFDNTNISFCKAIKDDGGAIFVKSSDTKIHGTVKQKNGESADELINTSSINDCHSGSEGGAIYTSIAAGCGNDVKIENLDFYRNSADSDGGAIETNGTHNRIQKCYFEFNHSRKTGGAIFGHSGVFYLSNQMLGVSDCVFYRNYADECSTLYLTYWDHIPENNKIYYDFSYHSNIEFGRDNITGFEAIKK